MEDIQLQSGAEQRRAVFNSDRVSVMSAALPGVYTLDGVSPFFSSFCCYLLNSFFAFSIGSSGASALHITLMYNDFLLVFLDFSPGFLHFLELSYICRSLCITQHGSHWRSPIWSFYHLNVIF